MIGTDRKEKFDAPGVSSIIPVAVIEEIQTKQWLTYKEASIFTGWTIEHLRNLVSAGRIPVYGKMRVRRFRRDMLNLFLTNPDAAMRKFRLERQAHGS